MGFHDVRKVLSDDVAAGGAEDVADEENVHIWILARVGEMRVGETRCEMRGARDERLETRCEMGRAEADPPPSHPSEPRTLAGDPGSAKDENSSGVKDDDLNEGGEDVGER
jgi:hypothetical protein